MNRGDPWYEKKRRNQKGKRSNEIKKYLDLGTKKISAGKGLTRSFIPTQRKDGKERKEF